jgi:archaellum component FlaD/FlaE
MAEAKKKQGNGATARDPEQIEREIEDTREDLGDTVAALAEKADVKEQGKRKVQRTKAKAKAKAEDVKESAAAKRQEFATGMQEAMPESASAGAQHAVGAVRENPTPAAIAGAFVAGVVVAWWLRR